MNKNNIKVKEGVSAVYTFAIFSSMLLWLLPIGLIAGFVNGFTPLHITITLSGIAHFLIALYMLCKNTLINNIVQIFLNISCSSTIIYFARLNILSKTFSTLSTFVIGVESIVIICLLVMIAFIIFKKK